MTQCCKSFFNSRMVRDSDEVNRVDVECRLFNLIWPHLTSYSFVLYWPLPVDVSPSIDWLLSRPDVSAFLCHFYRPTPYIYIYRIGQLLLILHAAMQRSPFVLCHAFVDGTSSCSVVVLQHRTKIDIILFCYQRWQQLQLASPGSHPVQLQRGTGVLRRQAAVENQPRSRRNGRFVIAFVSQPLFLHSPCRIQSPFGPGNSGSRTEQVDNYNHSRNEVWSPGKEEWGTFDEQYYVIIVGHWQMQRWRSVLYSFRLRGTWTVWRIHQISDRLLPDSGISQPGIDLYCESVISFLMGYGRRELKTRDIRLITFPQCTAQFRLKI